MSSSELLGTIQQRKENGTESKLGVVRLNADSIYNRNKSEPLLSTYYVLGTVQFTHSSNSPMKDLLSVAPFCR